MLHLTSRVFNARAAVFFIAALFSLQTEAAVRQVPAAYPTIQSAVNASASGDVIRVAAGVYAEQLFIRKSVQIVGAGFGHTVIRAPRRLREGVLGGNSIVEVSQGARVSLSFIGVRGPGAGTCEDGALFAGIRVIQGAHLNLNHADVRDIHDTPAALCFRSGVGIYIGDDASGSTATARITHSRVANYQTGGIIVLNEGSRAEIIENEVSGPGRAAALVTDGIEFVLGANGTIARNIVSGNVCGVPDLGCGPDFFENFQLSGIGAGAPGTRIFENVVFGNQVGIYVTETAQVRANLALSNDVAGIAVQDGNFTVDGGAIVDGRNGVAIIAAFADTRAVLKDVGISETQGAAVKKFECCGFHASFVRQSP